MITLDALAACSIWHCCAQTDCVGPASLPPYKCYGPNVWRKKIYKAGNSGTSQQVEEENLK